MEYHHYQTCLLFSNYGGDEVLCEVLELHVQRKGVTLLYREMRTTLKQQAIAIKKAMRQRETIYPVRKNNLGHWMKDLEGFRSRDKQWIALNDAYSTLISLSLNETVIKNFEKPIGKPKVKR